MTGSISRRPAALATWALVCAMPLAAQAPKRPAGPAAPARGAAPPAEPAVASYVSSRVNGKPMPVTDQATDDEGVQYLIEFDQLILTIRPNHEFRASLRYRQTLATKGRRLVQDPLRKMTVYGTWSVTGDSLRFVPDPKRGGGGLNILAGTFTDRRIEVPFDYQNGTVRRRALVLLVRDDRII